MWEKRKLPNKRMDQKKGRGGGRSHLRWPGREPGRLTSRQPSLRDL